MSNLSYQSISLETLAELYKLALIHWKIQFVDDEIFDHIFSGDTPDESELLDSRVIEVQGKIVLRDGPSTSAIELIPYHISE